MNKYLTNKTRLFFIQYPIVERSHKETSTQFACFVTPSAFRLIGLFPLLECPSASRSTIPNVQVMCNLYDLRTQPEPQSLVGVLMSRPPIGL